MTSTYRPDNRPSEIVWKYFEIEFEKCDFPSVSWALGSDWGVGSRVVDANQYKKAAYALMTKIYGPKPN